MLIKGEGLNPRRGWREKLTKSGGAREEFAAKLKDEEEEKAMSQGGDKGESSGYGRYHVQAPGSRGNDLFQRPQRRAQGHVPSGEVVSNGPRSPAGPTPPLNLLHHL